MPPAAPAPSFAGRFATVLVASLFVKVLRYQLFQQAYVEFLAWGLVSGAVMINLAYHYWSMPETYLKVGVSAFYNQMTLTPAAAYVWTFIKATMSPPIPPTG